MDGLGSKRQADADMTGPPGKKQKSAGAGKMSVAEKLMAKMGYKKGEGLGKGGTGIVNPIEVKLRPQGAGVGSVREMTKQAKEEARRVAERRGEEYHDSSEEEREASRRRKKEVKARKAAGLAPAAPTQARPRAAKIRTATEIEAEEGLVVPDIFKTLVDHTGAQSKQITSGAGIFTTALSSTTTETDKLVKHARIELEAFADAWRELKDRKTYLDFREAEIQKDIDNQKSHEQRLHRIHSTVNSMASLDISSNANALPMTEIQIAAERLAAKLDEINATTKDPDELHDLADIAIAVLYPIFKRAIDDWSPFEDDCIIVPILRQVKPFFERSANNASTEIDSDSDGESRTTRTKTLSPFDSMLFTLWLPKARNAIINHWDVHDPDPALSLLDDWKDVLPLFLQHVFVDQLVVHKLSQAIKSWRPSRSSKHNYSKPHQWIFPWLEHMDSYNLDARSSSGLLSEIKRKYRSALETCEVTAGTVDGIDAWLGVSSLKPELDKELQVRLLPRLAHYLRDRFDINPGDQDLAPFVTVFKWCSYFSAEKFARILVSAFFPKWHDALHHWLTDRPSYEDIGTWLEWWWFSVLPEAFRSEASVCTELEDAILMINEAVDLGAENAKRKLGRPGASKTASHARVKAHVEATTAAAADAEAAVREDIRDILEELCEREHVILMPLRKAHPETGLPLLKVTANASGSGGTVIFAKDNIVWAQNRQDKNKWDAVDIFPEGTLAVLAE